MGWRGTGPAVLALTVFVGCGGPKGPATYPVRGKVVYADGKPMEGGAIQFQPSGGGSGAAVAEIHKDGTFTLCTLSDEGKVGGAPAGTYRVLVLPPLGTDQTARPARRPVTLPGFYTVSAAGGNDFTLTIPRPQ